MIFEEIVLHNFGAYKGRQTLNLAPPSQKKPIVLIGGLNGGGKTTLLDAIHLSLYGKRARCSNRGALAYDDYLRRSIHRSAHAYEGAALALQFRQRTEGVEHVWRVHRSWAATTDGVTERLEIIRDGAFDRVLTEAWLEMVEEFIPVEISSLFFFDGEKIEGFADPENSTQLLSSAIHSLLGLDLVDRLTTDLTALERRKQTALKTGTERKEREEAEAEINRLTELRAEITAQRGAALNHAERRQYDLRKVEERFRREGGDLYERREQLETDKEDLDRQLKNVEAELREMAEGAAPLLLVSELLQAVAQQNRQEESGAQAATVGHLLTERDDWLLNQLQALRASNKLLVSIKALLVEDRDRRTAVTNPTRYLDLTNEGRALVHALTTVVLPEALQRIAKLIQQADELQTALEEAERRLAAVPAESAIASLIEEKQQAQSAVEASQIQLKSLDNKLEQATRELEQKQAILAALIEKFDDASGATQINSGYFWQ